jgi:hypothetical protein
MNFYIKEHVHIFIQKKPYGGLGGKRNQYLWEGETSFVTWNWKSLSAMTCRLDT